MPSVRPRPISLSAAARGWHREGGAVLLEVVLALVLFVGAATVLTSGLSSSLDGVERLRRATHAADLAVSVLSELQMGIKTADLSGPQPFEEPLEAWTWEVVASPMQDDHDESNPYRNVEIIIRHDESELVYRLNQVLRLDQLQASGEPKRLGTGSF